LRAADLNGSVGLFRLKEELTRRVNAAISQPGERGSFQGNRHSVTDGI
jgi:hypothetical protein